MCILHWNIPQRNDIDSNTQEITVVFHFIRHALLTKIKPKDPKEISGKTAKCIKVTLEAPLLRFLCERNISPMLLSHERKWKQVLFHERKKTTKNTFPSCIFTITKGYRLQGVLDFCAFEIYKEAWDEGKAKQKRLKLEIISLKAHTPLLTAWHCLTVRRQALQKCRNSITDWIQFLA